MSTTSSKPFRVMMWCVPRSISTAITKCFSFIDNTQIWLEPYCSIFMSRYTLAPAGIKMPQDKTEIDGFLHKIESMEEGSGIRTTFDQTKLDKSTLLYSTIQEGLNSLPKDKNVFVKDMAFGITGHYSDLPSKETGFRHAFLIRNPERVFPSWRNLLFKTEQHFRLPDLPALHEDSFDFIRDTPYMVPGYSYKCQYDLWRHIKESDGDDPVVIDADEVLANPGELLPKFCKAMGMPWDEKYLRWDPSTEGALQWRWMFKVDVEEELVSMIYKTALTSAEFRPPKPAISRSRMTPDVIKAVDETMGYYQEMAASRITL